MPSVDVYLLAAALLCLLTHSGKHSVAACVCVCARGWLRRRGWANAAIVRQNHVREELMRSICSVLSRLAWFQTLLRKINVRNNKSIMVTAAAWELYHSADWLNVVAAVIDKRLWLKAGMDMFILVDKYSSKTNLNGPSTNSGFSYGAKFELAHHNGQRCNLWFALMPTPIHTGVRVISLFFIKGRIELLYFLHLHYCIRKTIFSVVIRSMLRQLH